MIDLICIEKSCYESFWKYSFGEKEEDSELSVFFRTNTWSKVRNIFNNLYEIKLSINIMQQEKLFTSVMWNYLCDI